MAGSLTRFRSKTLKAQPTNPITFLDDELISSRHLINSHLYTLVHMRPSHRLGPCSATGVPQTFLSQNVCRAHPLHESAITSWLASDAASASGDGRLACLSAIGHLIRQQEGEARPVTSGGLRGRIGGAACLFTFYVCVRVNRPICWTRCLGGPMFGVLPFCFGIGQQFHLDISWSYCPEQRYDKSRRVTLCQFFQ